MNERRTEPEIDSLHEELVAYLDGELDTSEVQRVERRLADDVAYRQQLNQLARAWDLLDQLPSAHVDENFTHTTLKLVKLKAEADVTKGKAAAVRWRLLAWLLGASAAVVAACAGYVLVMNYFSGPNDRLAQDLPVIENVDLYRHAESVEFLKALESEGLFDKEVQDAS